MKGVRRILHPTDFSRASGAAFLKAVALAKESRAQLLLVHVLLPTTPFIGDGYISPKTYEELEASARRGAQRELAKVVAKAQKAKARVTATLPRKNLDRPLRP